MKVKVGSYNVSGGFYIGNEDQEYLDREASEKIDNKLLQEIIDVINAQDLDVVCFQEIITTKEIKYIEKIIQNTQLKCFKAVELSPCNIVKNTNCGVAILSKYPIVKSSSGKFPNPMLSKTTVSGNTYYTYDKGYLICTINKGAETFKILTHHGFPYRRFNSDAKKNAQVFEYFDEIIVKHKPDVITGDFNTEDFMELLTETALNYKQTIKDATTVDGKKFDNILISVNAKYNAKIIKLLSDHYLILADIDF